MEQAFSSFLNLESFAAPLAWILQRDRWAQCQGHAASQSLLVSSLSPFNFNALPSPFKCHLCSPFSLGLPPSKVLPFTWIGLLIFQFVLSSATLIDYPPQTCHSCISYVLPNRFPGSSDGKDLPTMPETQVPSLGWEEPLEKGRVTHLSILAWRIWWIEEPGRL